MSTGTPAAARRAAEEHPRARGVEKRPRRFTIQRYCSTTQTYYGLRFPYPDKPLDDAEVAALAADIDALEHRLVPALVTKSSLVSELLP